MRRGLKDFVWLLLLAVSAAHAERWSSKRPWLCEGYFAKKIPELVAFENSLQAHIRFKEQDEAAGWYQSRKGVDLKNRMYEEMINQKRELFQVLSWEIFKEVIEGAPYNQLGSTARATLISWALENWFFPHDLRFLNAREMEHVYTFLSSELLRSPSYTGDDLDRLRFAFERFHKLRESMSDAPTVHRSNDVQKSLFNFSVKVMTLEELPDRWNRFINDHTTKDRSLKTHGHAKIFVEGSIKLLAALPGVAHAQKLNTLRGWVKILAQINRLNGQEVLDCLRSIKIAAYEFGIPEDQAGPLFQDMRKIFERWGTTTDNGAAGMEILKARYERAELPN
jgi:hypothetical protein